MSIGTKRLTKGEHARAVAWVVPGPLRQLTGGYLYDARVVDGLRQRGWMVGVADLRSRRWPLDPAASRRLLSALGRQCWSAVVADELAHPALVAGLAGGRLRGVVGSAPLIVLVHHPRFVEPGDRWRRVIAMLVERLVMRAADLLICTSETTARAVRPLVRPGAPVEVVRPGWDTHGGCPLTTFRYGEIAGVRRSSRANGDAQHDGQSAAGQLRLLLVGHWTPRKGILDAIAAVARLGPAITLDLVGEQDRDPWYAARVWSALRDPALTGRVQVHGLVSSEALAAHYAGADALLLPSTYEGYGMVLAEALVAGLPVVATRVGAVPEVVRDGYEAALAPPGDIAALAQEIDRLASDPTERRRRGRLASERALGLPRWADSIAAFDGHLRAALARTLSEV